MRRESTINWRANLVFTAIAAIVLPIVAVVELSVFGPRRLENERQARRESPPKLVLPSPGQAESDQPKQSDKLTAFRKEEWRLPLVPEISSAVVYPADRRERAMRTGETNTAIKRMLDDLRRENAGQKPASGAARPAYRR